MFEYFYHEILRRTIIAFGSLFNGIDIKHLDSAGNISEEIKDEKYYVNIIGLSKNNINLYFNK